MADEQIAPGRPRLPQRNAQRTPPGNATFLAFAGLLTFAVCMAGLIAAAMTGFAPFAFVVSVPIVAVVSLLFSGHYLIWGVWLDRMLAKNGAAKPVDFWKRSPPPVEMLPDDAFSE